MGLFDLFLKKNKIKTDPQRVLDVKGGMRLDEAEVDIMFIVKNNQVIYINDNAEHLFFLDKDNDKKLDGRIVNFRFIGQSDKCKIEFFVAFNEQESYSLFTMKMNLQERLAHCCQEIFKFIGEGSNFSIFSPTERYATQYEYTFKLYQKNATYFMINNSQSQAFLLNQDGIKRDDVGGIMTAFWDES